MPPMPAEMPNPAPTRCIARTGAPHYNPTGPHACPQSENGAHHCHRPLQHDDGLTVPSGVDTDPGTGWFYVGEVEGDGMTTLYGEPALHGADHRCRCGAVWTCVIGSVLNPRWPYLPFAESGRLP